MSPTETSESPPAALHPEATAGSFGLRPTGTGSALSRPPRSDPRGERISRLTGSLSLRPAKLLASLPNRPELSPATETFTSGLPTGWSPFPSPDITTVVSGRSPPAGLSPARTAASFAAPPLCHLGVAGGEATRFLVSRASRKLRCVWCQLGTHGCHLTPSGVSGW